MKKDKDLSRTTKAEIYALEESLWVAETRFDDALMDSLFAPDFEEVGRSGRRYTRADMLLGRSGIQDIPARLPLQHFTLHYLDGQTVMTRYISEVHYENGTEYAHRTSIWTKTASGWKLRFHQGTPTAPPTDPAL